MDAWMDGVSWLRVCPGAAAGAAAIREEWRRADTVQAPQANTRQVFPPTRVFLDIPSVYFHYIATMYFFTLLLSIYLHLAGYQCKHWTSAQRIFTKQVGQGPPENLFKN